IAREDSRRPLVVARPLRRIPRTGIRGAVIDEIERRVVRQETPDGAAADLPCFARPRARAEILAAILRIERLELVADKDLAVRPGAVRAPQRLAALRVERLQPSAHAIFAAAVADVNRAVH